MKFNRLLALSAIAICISCTETSFNGPVYLNPDAPLEDRVEDALSRLTLEEKVGLIHAQSKFSSAGVKRLGIPELWCTDGPHGVRPEVLWDQWRQAGWTNDSVVAYPALTNLAATWNTEMSALFGKSIGEEARYREKDVLLGPGVNIYRTPLGGRNFEYMGEDPYLASRMVVPYIEEVQKNGVAACVKHFCLNNEETHRHTVDVDLSDRALYEIYLPAFEAAVKEAHSWSIMGSYNLYRGRHVCHHPRLLNEILKGEWGFDGVVISDWGGVHDTDEAAEGGMDLEFGTWTDGLTMGATNAYDNYFLSKPYLAKLRSGEADIATLDDKARRVLRLIFRTAMLKDKPYGSLCSEEHIAAARKIGGEGIVLLKNDGNTLPLKGVKSILVVGENAIKMMTVGGGSSSLKVQHEVSPLEGITAQAEANGIKVSYARGYVGDVRGNFDGVSSGQDLRDNRSAEELIAEAAAMAAEADAVIFVGGLNKADHQDCEGVDRLSYGLPYAQDDVIRALAAANSRLTVALVSGNAVEMPWIEQVPSIVEAWYGGSEGGNALADVLFGTVCPSGKLPFTFPRKLEDSPAHLEGMSFPNDGKCNYDEGIYVGYRWHDAKNIEPLFAFGHGLSYTTFEFGNPSCKKAGEGYKLTVSVKNTGSVAGAEVVQVYAAHPETGIDRPYKELKGFAKVYLQPGESKNVTVELGDRTFKYFDEASHSWKTEPGRQELLVGAASDDIRGSVSVTLK